MYSPLPFALSLPFFDVILTFGTTGVAVVKLAGPISEIGVGGGSHDKSLAITIFVTLCGTVLRRGKIEDPNVRTANAVGAETEGNGWRKRCESEALAFMSGKTFPEIPCAACMQIFPSTFEPQAYLAYC